MSPSARIRSGSGIGSEKTMKEFVIDFSRVRRLAMPRLSRKASAQLAAAVMESSVGDRTLTEVVTVGRQDVEAAVQQALQQAVDRYDMGLRIDQVVLQDVNPPDPVKPSWDEVNQAQQQRDRLINEARAQY